MNILINSLISQGFQSGSIGPGGPGGPYRSYGPGVPDVQGCQGVRGSGWSARMRCIQKMYGLHGLIHQIIELLGTS